MFLLFIEIHVPKEKWYFWKKLKLISPSSLEKTSPTHFNNCSAPPFSYIQIFFSPTPIKTTKERMNLLPFYMTDILFTELEIHNIWKKTRKMI